MLYCKTSAVIKLSLKGGSMNDNFKQARPIIEDWFKFKTVALVTMLLIVIWSPIVAYFVAPDEWFETTIRFGTNALLIVGAFYCLSILVLLLNRR